MVTAKPSANFRLPDRIGPYRIVHRIGSGGMGTVYLGLTSSAVAVAVKVLSPAAALDPESRVRLAREVATLRRVKHPQVAEVLDADVAAEVPYVVTAFVPGRRLDDQVMQDGPLSVAEAARLGIALVGALEHIHLASIVHRDLKPSNVMMDEGEPVLIDFGIAHLLEDSRLTASGLVMGTPAYLAPELIHGEPLSAAADWWAWGATLAYAASGVHPFGTAPLVSVLERVGSGRADLEKVDPALRPVIELALAVDPDERAQGQELMAALRALDSTQVIDVSATELIHVAKTVAAPANVAAAPAPASASVQQEQPATPPPGHPAARPEPSVRVLTPSPGTLPDPAWGPPAEMAAFAPVVGRLTPPTGAFGYIQEPAQRSLAEITGVRRAVVGTEMLVVLACTSLALVIPYLGLLALLITAGTARAVEASALLLIAQRRVAGHRRRDIAWRFLAFPWRMLMGAFWTVIYALLPMAVLAPLVLALAVLVIGDYEHSARLAVGVTLALGIAQWWMPGRLELRRGSDRMLASLVQRKRMSWLFVGFWCLMIVSAVLVYLGL